MFAKVIVDVAHSDVDRIFEYRVPEGMNLSSGCRVLVPFGAGNKPTEGYVTGLADSCAYGEKNVKSILRPMEEYAALTEGQIRLAEWIKEYYHTPLAAALRLMFPAELRGERIREKKTPVLFFNGGAGEDTEKSFFTREGKVKSPNKLALYRLLRKHGSIEARRLPKNAKAAVAAAVKEGWARKEELESFRRPLNTLQPQKTDFTLSAWQEEALGRISRGIETGGRFLLHGVTGSGKTEVYIRAIEKALKMGKTAIVLVPEISLTPQLTNMFRQRLDADVAVLHSLLSAGERFDEWRKIRRGNCKVVIGARSAVFAPLDNLGIIIMDEEHETSYKSDIHPKYMTHEIAVKRSEIEGCALVLGSATPSVETYYAAKCGAYELLSMPKRLFGLELPQIVLADMREEIKKGNRTIFSGALYAELVKTLKNGAQAMLFINRRGHSTFVMCRGCGYVEYCSDCAVTMTYHSASNMMKCHYCGRTRPVLSVCPECGKPYLKQFGIGTQKVEEETAKHFPGARVLRMDLDTMKKKDEHVRMYERFKNGEADILIGTQMIAKGFDFDQVRLVGVIAADTSLYFPDYRSAERTFQLIEQVSGRAGRRSEGLVVVQTYAPEHYAVKYAASHDYEGFYGKESELRQKSFLPPFGLFIRFIFSGAEEKRVMEAAEDFRAGLEGELKRYQSAVLMLECGAAPIKKIEGKTRYQILVKIKNDSAADAVKGILYEYTKSKRYTGLSFGLELNPLNMV